MRALKLRYYEDRNFTERLKEAPGAAACIPEVRENDWGRDVRTIHEGLMQADDLGPEADGLSRRQARSVAEDRTRSAGPVKSGGLRARTRAPLQASLFDALVQADSLEQATGIDLKGNGE